MKVNFKISPVLVGVDKDGKDMITVLIDRGVPCPPICDVLSQLNK